MRVVLRAVVVFAVTFAIAYAFQDPAAADNCAGFTDCFATARAAIAASAGLAFLAAMFSLLLDFLPGIGTAKGLVELVTGEDMVTGEELAWWERALGILPIIGGLAGMAGSMARAADRVGDAAGGAGSAGRAAGGAGSAGRAGDAAGNVRGSRSGGTDYGSGGRGPRNRGGDAAGDAGRAGDAAGSGSRAGDAGSAGRTGDAAGTGTRAGDGPGGSGGRTGRTGGGTGSAGRGGDAIGGTRGTDAVGARRTGDAAGARRAGDAGDAAGDGSRAADGHPDLKKAPRGTEVPPERVPTDFGMPEANFRKFQRVAARHDVTIEVRPTNPASLRHLEAGARPKPEWLKSKTINEWDVHLGFKEEHIGLVGHRKPDVPTRPADMSDADWAKVEQRYRDRLKWYDRNKPKMERAAAEDVAHVTPDGVVIGGKNHMDADGNVVAGEGWEGQGFAGDHDVFAIRDSEGNLLSPEEAQPIIEDLITEGAGVEHGAHRNWNAPESQRDTFEGIVTEHTEVADGGGGEGLLAIHADGTATVSYNSD